MRTTRPIYWLAVLTSLALGVVTLLPPGADAVDRPRPRRPAPVIPEDAPVEPAEAAPDGRLTDWTLARPSLPACVLVGQRLSYGVNAVRRGSAVPLTAEEIRAQGIGLETIVDDHAAPAHLVGNTFEFEWLAGDTPRTVRTRLRLLTPDGPVEGPPVDTEVVADTRLVLPPELSFGDVSSGCGEQDHCELLDPGASRGLPEGMTLSLERPAPDEPGGWPELRVVVVDGGGVRSLERGEPLLVQVHRSAPIEICYSPPRCEDPPSQASEPVRLGPVSPCLDVIDQECRRAPETGCDPDVERGATVVLVADVRPNGWVSCNLWWIRLVVLLLWIIAIAYGFLSPCSFPSAAVIRVANSQRALTREPGRPLRGEPHGKRGFYRSATCCFASDGTTVRKTQSHVLMLKAGPGNTIAIGSKGAALERLERRAFRPVDPTGRSPQALAETQVVSGAIYRVDQAFFFQVDY